jgi:hypothetical protein
MEQDNANICISMPLISHVHNPILWVFCTMKRTKRTHKYDQCQCYGRPLLHFIPLAATLFIRCIMLCKLLQIIMTAFLSTQYYFQQEVCRQGHFSAYV